MKYKAWIDRKCCIRKMAHANAISAMQAYINMGTRGEMIAGLGIYVCEFCGFYHLGRRSPKYRARKLRRYADRNVIAKLISRLV